jgi:hypothetical protein
MMNFVLKAIHKNFISKLGKEKKKFVDIYRAIMKFVVKYHKLAGIITSLTVIIHLILMSIYVEVSISGLIAMTAIKSKYFSR